MRAGSMISDNDVLALALVLDSDDFTYDIYTLIRAFYPGKELKIVDEALQADKYAFVFSVSRGAETVTFSVQENVPKEKTGTDSENTKIVRTGPRDTRDRISEKNSIKKLIYRTLAEVTGICLPWGDLTGIRPVKIPMKLLEQGENDAAILSKMRDEYFVSEKKASLALDIAKREKLILDSLDPENGYSLYIGIPFCPSICLYCSFGSHPLDRFGHLTDAYLEALFAELRYIAGAMRGKTLTSIYVGGGTPTSLEAEQIAGLLSYVRNTFPCEHLREFTFEAGRPDTVTSEKLAAIKEHGVGRISINPQTMNDRTLETIGRAHTAKEIEKAFELARDAGFDNINADIIVGLPGEGEKEVKYTLERLAPLGPESLTVHSLALKRATRLNLFKENYLPVAFQNSESIMDMVSEEANESGLRPYYLYRQKNMAGNFENTGYAKPEKYGIYNILIMEEKQTIMAAGSGAVTKVVYPGGRIERAANVKDIHHYIERTDEMIARKEKLLT